ncbi:MAG: carboxypeptidase regulatory-like domain-containing protein [Myxococcales bacterium]|nr:carboxypeptidase regulatory-like domain-containing protein [Myxococcales bacterium]
MRSSALGAALLGALAVVSACGLKGPGQGNSGAGGVGGASSTASAGGGATVTSSGPTATTGTAGGGAALTPEFTVSGIVVDQAGEPVLGALVLQAGRSTEPTAVTGKDGAFTITMLYSGLGTPTVVATKIGYRTNGHELPALPQGPVTLTLRAVGPPDNLNYQYGEPGHGDDPSTKYCGHCHMTITHEFQTSKHSEAAEDPFVQDLYAGVSHTLTTEEACNAVGGTWRIGTLPGSPGTGTPRCYIGKGVLPDLNPACGTGALACDDPALPAALTPKAFGACADCHSPGISGPAGDRNLLEAEGVGFVEGVHCDFCHKVADVDLALPPGAGKRLRVQRPSETHDGLPDGKIRAVMFGPLLDVPNPFMGGSYQPLFATATFCAGCHQQVQEALIPGETLAPRFANGLPTHSTYEEWVAGPYDDAGVPCQHCHMPKNFELESTTELGKAATASITFGFPRPPEQVRRHIFRSPLEGSPRLIDGALVTVLAPSIVQGELVANITIGNGGCGHAVPTGEPMRALVMLVEASCDGVPLAATGGLTVDDIGGMHARGVFGPDLSMVGAVLSWPAAALIAKAGEVVRVVRATGAFHDYVGIGIFDTLTPAEKGIAVFAPVASAVVTSVAGDKLTLDAPLAVLPGDVLYLGDASTMIADSQPSRALAGLPGATFARVMLDSAGVRQAPHYRAIDIASDNRIQPGKPQHTTHRFTLTGCAGKTASVALKILYRPIPLALAAPRAWPASDYVIATDSATLAIP